MAFPQYIDTASTSFGSSQANPFAINLPTGISSGELLFMTLVIFGGVEVSNSGGFTENTDTFLEGMTVELLTKEAIGNEGSTESISFDVPGNVDAMVAQVHRFHSWNSIEFSGFSSGSGANPNPPSFSPSFAPSDILWVPIVAARDDDANVDSAPADYTLVTGAVSGGGTNSGATGGAAYRPINTTTEDPGTFGLSESESWVTAVMAIEPGSKGAPGGGSSNSGASSVVMMKRRM